ncbi:hypothetical protein BC831DRAFT_549032 [Entophlyctis helioformis]|nr:hypothetical protein BC831DRAFT_549032 [Entophlyctis helioformis]
MPAPIPFDPPRFDQPEDFVAICIGVGCFPLVCYAWYHAALAFFRTHKQLPSTLLLLLTVALFRNIATVTVTFLYTSLPLLLFRLWLFCVEMYILNVWIMFFLLWMMKTLTFVWPWVPAAFAVVMNGIYFGMFLPRAFYYTLFMTPSENTWAANWYRATFNPYLLVANVIGGIICGFVVFTLHWNFSKLAERLDNELYRANINQNLPQSTLIQSTVFWLTVYLTLYVLFTFAVFGLSSLNDVVIRPAPSAGWRRAQSLTCIAGHFVILNSVLVWFIAKSLKVAGSLGKPSPEFQPLLAEWNGTTYGIEPPLTAFLDGELGDKKSLDKATIQAIWAEVFETDWQGDLWLLPYISLDAGAHGDGLMLRVRSRAMYQRLLARFPRKDDTDTDRTLDRAMNTYCHHGTNTHSGDLIHIAMHNGWFDVLDFRFPIALGWLAIIFGHTALLQHLAFTLGTVDLAQFERFGPYKAMDWAGYGGHVEILQMLHAAGSTACTTYAMDGAAAGGHLDTVIWLHLNRHEGCTAVAMTNAAANGHLDVVQWLHANRAEGCTARAMDGAAGSGRLDIVHWLHHNRSEGCTTDAMDWAAQQGHMDVVRWLHVHRREGCTTDAMDGAARNGRLDMLQWLHENRTEGCTTFAVNRAAEFGHRDVLEWLHNMRGVRMASPRSPWSDDARDGDGYAGEPDTE